MVACASAVSTNSIVSDERAGELAFQIIHQYDYSYYEGDAHQLMVINNAASVREIPVWLTPYAYPAPERNESTLASLFTFPDVVTLLKEVDYNRFIGVIVFQGQRPTGGYRVAVTHVTHDNGTINIHANFEAPTPEMMLTNIVTSPYQVIMVERPKYITTLTFELVANSASTDVTTPSSAAKPIVEKGSIDNQIYGNLQETLYLHLEELGEDDVIRVAIWLMPPDNGSASEIEHAVWELLAEKYPEVRETLERSGRGLDIDDPQMVVQVDREYGDLFEARLNERVAPFVEELRQKGYSVDSTAGMPSVTAALPKSLILELARRADVSMIYLVENPMVAH